MREDGLPFSLETRFTPQTMCGRKQANLFGCVCVLLMSMISVFPGLVDVGQISIFLFLSPVQTNLSIV